MHETCEPKALVNRVSLRQFDIFKDLSAHECSDIAQRMRVKRYKPTQSIISEEHQCCDVFFIISGLVRACCVSRTGKQVNFEDLGNGEMFGEFSAIDQQGRSANCIAMTETMIAMVSGTGFHQIMDSYPKVKDAVLRRVVGIARKHMQRVSDNAFYSVGQRVRFELVRLGSEVNTDSDTVHLESVPTHDDIALRIGARREAVTRELSSLQSRGLITWNRSQHVIHRMSDLLDHAEK